MSVRRMRVRTVANKSKLKVSIIQRIDRKVALDEIALTNGLEFTELLDEIEAIVYSGTRINIDYFLNDVMDEDHIEDIYEYFKDSETYGSCLKWQTNGRVARFHSKEKTNKEAYCSFRKRFIFPSEGILFSFG